MLALAVPALAVDTPTETATATATVTQTPVPAYDPALGGWQVHPPLTPGQCLVAQPDGKAAFVQCFGPCPLCPGP